MTTNITKSTIATPVKLYGEPTSCEDLNKIGHSLNGFYNVLNKKDNSSDKIRTVELVYCDFHRVNETIPSKNYIYLFDIFTTIQNCIDTMKRKSEFR